MNKYKLNLGIVVSLIILIIGLVGWMMIDGFICNKDSKIFDKGNCIELKWGGKTNYYKAMTFIGALMLLVSYISKTGCK